MELMPKTVSPWSALAPALETMVRSNLPLEDVQEMFVRAYVQTAIKLHDGNLSAASRAIRVHRNTMYRWYDR